MYVEAWSSGAKRVEGVVSFEQDAANSGTYLPPEFKKRGHVGVLCIVCVLGIFGPLVVELLAWLFVLLYVEDRAFLLDSACYS